MKKFSKRFKAGLSLILVCGMVLGNAVSARATAPSYVSGVSVDNLKNNEGIDNTAAEYNDKEPAEYQSDVDAMESLAIVASSAAVDAKEAANTAANKATEAVSQAAIANGEADKAVSSAAIAKSEAALATADAIAASSAAVEFVSDVNDYNGKVSTANNAVSQAAVDAQAVCGNIATDTAIAAERTAELKEAALQALEDALNAKDDASLTEEQKNEAIIKAAVEAANAAESAKEVVSQAALNVKAAEDAKNTAIAEYNKYAMTYGFKLYDEKVTYTKEDLAKFFDEKVTYTKEDLANAGIVSQADVPGELKDDYDDIQKASVADHKKNIEEAVKTFNEAVENYDKAKEAADGAADAAATAAKTAADECDEAELAASKVYNYYITPAQEALDSTNNKLSDATSRLSSANSELSTAQTNYDNKKDAMVQQAKTDYANTKAARQEERDNAINNAYSEYQKAVEEWNNANLLKKSYYWTVVGAKRTAYEGVKAYQEASYSLWLKDHTESKAVNNAIDAANKTTEKALLDQAAAKVNAINSEISDLNSTKATQEATLSAAKTTAANNIKDIQAGLDEANQKLIHDISELILADNNNINQEQFNKAMNDFANDVNLTTALAFWTQSHKDAHAVRKELAKEYDQELWKSIINAPGILQGLVSTEELNKKMDARIKNYRNELQVLYEKKASMEAEVAKLGAEAAETSANTSAVNASASAVSIKEIAAELETVVSDAQDAVNDAETQVNAAKATATEWYKLDKVDLSKLLNAIVDAESQLEAAKKSLEVATAAKDKAVKYAEYADNYDEYAKADGQLQQFTALVEAEVEPVRGESVVATTTGFVAVSDETLDVPETIYRKYLKAIVTHEKDETTGIADEAGKGVAIGTAEEAPILYWEVKEGVLTGKYFTSTTDLETGKYFIGKSFVKNAADYDMVGVMVDYVKPVPYTPSYPNNNIVVNNTEKKDDTVVPSLDLNNDKTPEGSASETTDEQPVITVEDDKEATPQSAAPGLNLTDDITAEGAALAQTGTVPVVVFYFAAVALLLAALYFKKSFAKEN